MPFWKFFRFHEPETKEANELFWIRVNEMLNLTLRKRFLLGSFRRTNTTESLDQRIQPTESEPEVFLAETGARFFVGGDVVQVLNRECRP